MDFSLGWGGNPQEEEFNYLGVFFTSGRKREWEVDRLIGEASAVIRPLHRAVLVTSELSRKANVFISQSIFVPTLWS